MKFLLSFLFLATAFADLEDDWAIETGSLFINTPDAGTHKVTFEHGQGDQVGTPDPPRTRALIYGKSGAADALETCYSNGGSLIENPAALGLDVGDLFTDPPPTVTSVPWTFTDAIDDSVPSEIYTETTVDGVVVGNLKFCVYFALYTEVDGDIVDVNYREIAVDMTINLDGTFAIEDAFTTDPADVASETASLDYGVEANVCNGHSNEFIAGELVPICICTTEYPVVRVDSIESLVFDSTDSVHQDSIVDGAIWTTDNVPLSEVEVCGQPDAATLPTYHCCQANTMLVAEFYAGLGNDGLDTDEVIASGVVNLEIGARRLQVPIRKLESTQEDYETKIYLAEDGSGAVKSRAVAAAVMAAAAAIML